MLLPPEGSMIGPYLCLIISRANQQRLGNLQPPASQATMTHTHTMCQTFDESFRHWAPHESLSTATTQCVPKPASSPCAKCDRGQWLTSHFRLGLFTTQFDQKLSLHFLQCQATAMDVANRTENRTYPGISLG